MKKFLIALLSVICTASFFAGVGCVVPPDNDGGDDGDGGQTCVHEYKDGYYLEDAVVYIGKKCKKCNEIDKQTATAVSANLVVKQNDNLTQAMSIVKDGDVVVFAKGGYMSVNTKSGVSNVRYIAETGASFKTVSAVSGNAVYENFTITGLGDRDAFNIKGQVTNITVKNCAFNNHGGIFTTNDNVSSVTNLVVENCVFKNLVTDSSAIILLKYDGLTVKNCQFESVGYNALQVGNQQNAGKVLIEGNIFKEVQSRVLYLVYVDNLEECEIKNNIFYDHEHVYSVVDDGAKKSTGVYIHTKSTSGVLTVGVNSWESVPSGESKYIAPVAQYNPQEQTEISVG